MFFIAQLLLMMAVWGGAAAVAEVEAKTSQHVAAAIIHTAVVGWGLGMAVQLWLDGPPEDWQTKLLIHVVTLIASYIVGQLIARFAYVVDGAQANKMALAAAVANLLLTLFWRWAVST